MTPEQEKALDARAERIYDRMDALVHFAAAYFNDLVRERGYTGGRAERESMNRCILFRARKPDGQEVWQRFGEDVARHLVDQTERQLYPRAGAVAKTDVLADDVASRIAGTPSNPDFAEERAYLFRPLWSIEKAGAKNLANLVAGELSVCVTALPCEHPTPDGSPTTWVRRHCRLCGKAFIGQPAEEGRNS